MTEITINFTYIFAVMYAAFKAAASVWICKREFQYPIWNKEGVQVERGLHKKAQSFLRNWAINPEWALLKAVAFAPVFLVTGKRHILAYMPWRVQKTPPFCRECNDKGSYYVDSFIAGPGQGNWHDCECRKSNAEIPSPKPDCTCHVCLDQGSIGKNRPCPHCERRGMLARDGDGVGWYCIRQNSISNDNQSVKIDPLPDFEKAHGTCGSCGKLCRLTLVNESWFCSKCFSKKTVVDVQDDFVKTAICEKCDRTFTPDLPHRRFWCSKCCFSREISGKQDKQRLLSDPYRYLKGDCFSGDPSKEPVQPTNTHSCRRSGLCRKQPTELQVGDTIVVKDVSRGHRDENLAGKDMLILGLNLPFAVVEYDLLDGLGRWSKPIDLRGMQIYRERVGVKSQLEKYQPLLNPSALKVGDTFVVLAVREGETDGSFRGDAYRVVKSTHRAPYENQGVKDVIETELLSYRRTAGATSHLFACEKLQAISVNDQYIDATRTHHSDLT